MKSKKEFKKFEELKAKYYKNPTKAQKEEVVKEVANLISNGWITKSMKIVYDYGTMELKNIELLVWRV